MAQVGPRRKPHAPPLERVYWASGGAVQGFGLVDLGAVLPLSDPASPNGMRNGSPVSAELRHRLSMPHRRRRIVRHCIRNNRPSARSAARHTDGRAESAIALVRIVKGSDST